MNIPFASFFLPRKKSDTPTLSIIKIKGVNQGLLNKRRINACKTGME